MNVYLVCFDITDDRVRYRVGKALAEYGERVQKSVYEISLRTPGELDALERALRELIEPDDDIRLYALCKACRRRSHDVLERRIAQFPAVVLI